MRLALALTSAQADRLRKEADRLGIAPAVLARATHEDLCDLPDAGFRATAERIVPKNQELSLASPDAVSDACRDPRAAPRDAGAVRWHAGHSRSGCPARCAGPAAPPWRPFSRCMGLSPPRGHQRLERHATPPRGHQRLERHATRLGTTTRLVWLRLATRVVLNYFYPGGRRVVQYRTLTSVLVSLSHPPGTFSAAPNSARRFVDGDGHHLVSPLALFQFLS